MNFVAQGKTRKSISLFGKVNDENEILKFDTTNSYRASKRKHTQKFGHNVFDRKSLFHLMEDNFHSCSEIYST